MLLDPRLHCLQEDHDSLKQLMCVIDKPLDTQVWIDGYWGIYSTFIFWMDKQWRKSMEFMSVVWWWCGHLRCLSGRWLIAFYNRCHGPVVSMVYQWMLLLHSVLCAMKSHCDFCDFPQKMWTAAHMSLWLVVQEPAPSMLQKSVLTSSLFSGIF